MKIRSVLNPALVTTSLKSSTKDGIIGELLDILVAEKKISDKQKVLKDVMEREKKMSTGIQHGVAIPHAKTTAVKELVACIGLKPEGVDFDSLDGEPSRIFIMTLSPVDRVGPHVQFLAEISTIIKTQESRTRLLQAKSAQEVLAVFGL
jgi:PTS system nitrogen regulatory IIA component